MISSAEPYLRHLLDSASVKADPTHILEVTALLHLAAALAATRVLRSLLFGVAPTDPLTFAAIVVLLVGAVLVASCLPARRAASIAPTEALREG